MRRRLVWIYLVLLPSLAVATLLLAPPALAGGWAVITLDSLPGEIVAGEPVEVGFILRQHGVTPMTGESPTIHLSHTSSGESLVVYAEEEGEPGHYSATFTLPEGGRWRWSIQAFNMDQPMPDLQATAAAAPVVSQAPERNSLTVPAMLSLPMLTGIAGTMIAVLGLIYALRRRSTWAMPIVAIGLLLGVAGFVRSGMAGANAAEAGNTFAASNTTRDTVSETDPTPIELSRYGEDLFIAKGCLSCHRNDRVDPRYTVFSTETGPNLTMYRVTHKTSPEYLMVWLKDPAAIKPETEMPNLGLSKAEIEALTTFLLEGSGTAGTD